MEFHGIASVGRGKIEKSNCDSHYVDPYGKRIIDLCNAASRRILNGRTRGDIKGRFTSHPRRHNDNLNVIDYLFAEPIFYLISTPFKLNTAWKEN